MAAEKTVQATLSKIINLKVLLPPAFSSKEFHLEIVEMTKMLPKLEDRVEIIRKSDVAKALSHLMELRRQTEVDVEENSLFSYLYYNLLLNYHNGTDTSVEMSREYLHGGGVIGSLSELKTQEFKLKKDGIPENSKIVKFTLSHLAILWNISRFDDLISLLGEQLRENDFFNVLMPFVNSKYLLLNILFI